MPNTPTPLPASVLVDTGNGGLDRVLISAPTGSAEIYLQGAHITAFTPTGADRVIWMSEQAQYAPGKALRGGVPICFPWFAANKADATAPAHGFARVTPWELVDAHEIDDTVAVTFRLTDSDATRASAWPHKFEAHYTVTVGAELALTLTVTNLDDSSFAFEEALHTYLAVGDIRSVEIGGLEAFDYFDKVTGTEKKATGTPITFAGETDSVYAGAAPTATVVDRSENGRAIAIDSEGSGSTVVWNPWIDKAAGMSDFGDNEWPTMVCVETSNVGEAAITLPPGASHIMSARYRLA
ncbi:MAG TPA: D-hexose-6-phosphate mutarotase [Glaciihabitans sp.]|jgi:glucose-6-phosphate 1-epimerase|nr:D-hexose-6-phosphate mutarotase [Glaciihabitans sp.]